ncbi:hypothetical protein SDC9_184718 [bioreactor metagenome]|uniref:Uncharacterized protein n=1 Tax=bioreactor metagenome TaxID=1076179 RepID=A0A645HFP0_9ZZZZ
MLVRGGVGSTFYDRGRVGNKVCAALLPFHVKEGMVSLNFEQDRGIAGNHTDCLLQGVGAPGNPNFIVVVYHITVINKIDSCVCRKVVQKGVDCIPLFFERYNGLFVDGLLRSNSHGDHSKV